MSARIGFDHYTIAHRGMAPAAVLEFAAARGFAGVQFLEPAALDSRLDPARLDAIRRQADRLGLYFEVGLPSPNPVRASRSLGRSVSAEEHAQLLAPHVDAVASLGCGYARVYVGDRHDRFRTDVRWETQLAASAAVLRHVAPQLRSLGVRVAIETHADLTADELLAMVDRVGADAGGVVVDTGNLLMRLDDPVRAAERLAPYVLATHVKDAVLAFTDRGLCWQARPIGSGVLPMRDVLAPLVAANPALNLSVELHPRTYDLPIYDPSWLDFFPNLRPHMLASLVQLAAACERRFATGALSRPEAVEAVPWAERDLDWLDRSLAYLRPLVATFCAG